MQVRIELANAERTVCVRKCWPTRRFRSAAASRCCWCRPTPCSRSTVRTWSSCGPRPDRFAVRPVQRRRNGGRQDADSRRNQGRRSSRRARQFHSQIPAPEIDPGERVAAMLNRIIDLTLAYRWLVLIGIVASAGSGRLRAVHDSGRGFPGSHEQPGGGGDGRAVAAAHGSRATGHVSDRTRDARPAEQAGSAVAVEARAVDGDDRLRRFGRRCISRGSSSPSGCSRFPRRLPRGIQPTLGLPATAFGELYQYTLSGPMSAMDLKDLHEWVIKPQLRTLPGVSEINAWGGQTKQFQIVVDPALLDQYGLTLHDVAKRVEDNNTQLRRRLYRARRRTIHAAGHRTRRHAPSDLGQHRSDCRRTARPCCCAMSPTCASAPRRRRARRCATAKRCPAWSSCSRAKTARS